MVKIREKEEDILNKWIRGKGSSCVKKWERIFIFSFIVLSKLDCMWSNCHMEKKRSSYYTK